MPRFLARYDVLGRPRPARYESFTAGTQTEVLETAGRICPEGMELTKITVLTPSEGSPRIWLRETGWVKKTVIATFQ